MSFGIGIGDILAVLNLADRLRKEWLDAPDEYNSICARLVRKACDRILSNQLLQHQGHLKCST